MRIFAVEKKLILLCLSDLENLVFEKLQTQYAAYKEQEARLKYKEQKIENAKQSKSHLFKKNQLFFMKMAKERSKQQKQDKEEYGRLAKALAQAYGLSQHEAPTKIINRWRSKRTR